MNKWQHISKAIEPPPHAITVTLYPTRKRDKIFLKLSPTIIEKLRIKPQSPFKVRINTDKQKIKLMLISKFQQVKSNDMIAYSAKLGGSGGGKTKKGYFRQYISFKPVVRLIGAKIDMTTTIPATITSSWITFSYKNLLED